MRSTTSLLPKLSQDFAPIVFTAGSRYAWSPDKKTVFYDESDPENVDLLFHELAHGVLNHHDYSKDVELVAMESEAWDTARVVAPTYGVSIANDTVQDSLDTYREWLHSRSTCPECEATGYQSGKKTYTCVACSQTWRVNEARICALRRYTPNK
jgi:hypothetical protein